MAWKNIKKWLGIGALAGGLLMPNVAKGEQDVLLVNNLINGKGHEIQLYHFDSATEEYDDGLDNPYAQPPEWTWGPKITTSISGSQLQIDCRPTNSISSFDANLEVFIHDGNAVDSTNKLQINIYSDGDFKLNPKRHYIAKFNIYSNYTDNCKEFIDRKNIRDLCPEINTYYDWNGPKLNIPSSQTNSLGEVKYGTYTQNCEWNQLVSSSTSGGTNTPQGAEILDYNTNKNVSLQANPGNYIDYFVLTRTDNTGLVSVVTNDIAGTSLMSTNVAIDGIKGSNSIYAVYAEDALPAYNVTVNNNGYGTPSPGTTNNVPSGTTLEQRISPAVTNIAPGTRVVLKGVNVTGNSYMEK